MYRRVKDNSKLVRDTKVGAILSIDNSGLEAYRLKKKQTEDMRLDINMLKNDLGEIKELLALLLTDRKNND